MRRATVHVLRSWAPTPSTWAIRVERPPGFAFEAGQHAIVALETDDGTADRSLSIACAPKHPHLDFAVRLSESAFKRRFALLRPGEGLDVTGPAGTFRRDTTRSALMISGGIGITPLLSMIESAGDGPAVPTTLLYASRAPDEIVFRETLDQLEAEHEHLRVLYHVDAPPEGSEWGGRVGRISVADIRRESERLGRPIHYLCGPPGMVDAMQTHLTALDVPKALIRREDFIGY